MTKYYLIHILQLNKLKSNVPGKNPFLICHSEHFKLSGNITTLVVQLHALLFVFGTLPPNSAVSQCAADGALLQLWQRVEEGFRKPRLVQ